MKISKLFIVNLLLMLIYGQSMAQEQAQKMENWVLYSQTISEFPEEQIKEIAGSNKYFVTTNEEGNKIYHYEWDDLKVKVNQMPKQKLENHLNGLVGYINHLYSSNNIEPNKKIIKRVSDTVAVFSIVIEPAGDETGRGHEIVGAIKHFTSSLMFYADTLLDENGEIIIGP
jgi:hypothetical protein